jgi:hypothetical protein
MALITHENIGFLLILPNFRPFPPQSKEIHAGEAH